MRLFCGPYLDIVLLVSLAFLVISLLIGVTAAVHALLKILRPPKGGEARTEISIPPVSSILEAMRGLVDALARAPAWFALFLAGCLLFWMAGKVVGNQCRAPAPPEPTRPPATRPAASVQLPAAAEHVLTVHAAKPIRLPPVIPAQAGTSLDLL